MLMKIIIACSMVTLVVVPATEAFGTDFLDWLLGEDSESDESSETVISAKPNTTVMVVCKTSCNLNVLCENCSKIDATMMKPTNGNGGGPSQPPNGNGMMTTPTATSSATSMDAGTTTEEQSAQLVVTTTTTVNNTITEETTTATTQGDTLTPTSTAGKIDASPTKSDADMATATTKGDLE